MKINLKFLMRIIAIPLLLFTTAIWSTQSAGLVLAQDDVDPAPFNFFFSPDPLSAEEGEEVEQTLGIESTSDTSVGAVLPAPADVPNDLYGIELEITFDPTKLEVQDADPDVPGIQVEESSLFDRDDVEVVFNEADNVEGKIVFAANVKTEDADPILTEDSSGTLLTITWLGLSSEASEITVTGRGVTKDDQEPPEFFEVEIGSGKSTVNDGIVEAPSGVILLQGRTDHSDTTVTLIEETCPEFKTASLVTTIAETVTEADGSFTFEDDALSAKAGCLQVFHHGYLTARNADPSGDLGTIKLLGGDVNKDDNVDIFDLAYIAGRYKGDDLTADINGDGQVDIFDLTITGHNFEQARGPLTDWQQ